ncbi:hypothetical protein GCM10027053_39980 [Intrasporangium mesophilum]
MTVTSQPTNRYVDRPAPSSLADVIEVILDKGLVIDAYVRVSLVGIELLTVDARIVVASVDTYLRFAEAVNRLDLRETETSGIPELVENVTESGAKGKTSGAIEGAKDKLHDILPGGDDDDDKDEDEDEDSGRGSRTRSARKQTASRSRSTSQRRSSSKEG